MAWVLVAQLCPSPLQAFTINVEAASMGVNTKQVEHVCDKRASLLEITIVCYDGLKGVEGTECILLEGRIHA